MPTISLSAFRKALQAQQEEGLTPEGFTIAGGKVVRDPTFQSEIDLQKDLLDLQAKQAELGLKGQESGLKGKEATLKDLERQKKLLDIEGGQFLNLEESEALNLPFGTPREEARQKKIVPKKKAQQISADLQKDLIEIETLNQLANRVERFSPDGRILPGVGLAGKGKVAQFLFTRLGIGRKEGEQVRNLIGQITGSIAKARGGTSFTPNEQALLESYTPTIKDTPQAVLTKLQGLKTFLAIKKASINQLYQAPEIEAVTKNNRMSDPLGIR